LQNETVVNRGKREQYTIYIANRSYTRHKIDSS